MDGKIAIAGIGLAAATTLAGCGGSSSTSTGSGGTTPAPGETVAAVPTSTATGEPTESSDPSGKAGQTLQLGDFSIRQGPVKAYVPHQWDYVENGKTAVARIKIKNTSDATADLSMLQLNMTAGHRGTKCDGLSSSQNNVAYGPFEAATKLPPGRATTYRQGIDCPKSIKVGDQLVFTWTDYSKGSSDQVRFESTFPG